MTLSSQILLYLVSVETIISWPAETFSYRVNVGQHQVYGIANLAYIGFVSHHAGTDLRSFLVEKSLSNFH
jgi:hypothetical protein